MKKVLLATTAISAVSLAGIASAQESQMMSAMGNTLSIGGYYEFGYASGDDDLDVTDGSDSKTYGDSELYIDFETTSDSGLTYGVQIDLEIVNGTSHGESGAAKNAEESSLYVGGDFGTLHFGHDDNAYGRFQTWAPTHDGALSQDDNVINYGGRFVNPAGSAAAIVAADNATINAGTAVTNAQSALDGAIAAAATPADYADEQKALESAQKGLATAEAARAALNAGAREHSLAHTAAGQGASYEDNAKVTYISPNFSGFQFGGSVMDSDGAEENPTAFGASYSVSGNDLSLGLTYGYHTNNADDDDETKDTQYGVTVGFGDLTLTAAHYDGDDGGTDKEATEFGIGYQVTDSFSIGAAFNDAESKGDVDQEGEFTSYSGAYQIAPGLQTTLAFNQFEVTDNAAKTSNDGSEIVWQIEFGF